MEIFTVQLTLDEINLIFKSLGERPFHEVFELIGNINEQVNQQIKADQNQKHQIENEQPGSNKNQ